MNQTRHISPAGKLNSGVAEKAKRPYTKPAFQHEKVFETMALACGKLAPTQAQCRFNRRSS